MKFVVLKVYNARLGLMKGQLVWLHNAFHIVMSVSLIFH